MKNEQVKHYMAGFIATKGGSERVAKETGLNRQTLRQIVNGRNGASQPIIDALATFYPDFDRSFGQEVRTLVQAAGVKGDAGLSEIIRQQQQIIAKLEARIEKLETKNDELANENREINGAFLKLAYPDLFVDREGVKIGSDSQVTDLLPYQQANPIGFAVGQA